MNERRASLTADLGAVDPELVLVFEVVGTVERFINAVSRIEGFEYLAEIDEFGIDAEVFRGEDAVDSGPWAGSLYLLASNQDALSAVLALWDQYQADETVAFGHGLAPWKNVFRLLADIRRWGPSDRLRGTGVLEDFSARVAAGETAVPAEIELWFRSDPAKRDLASAAVSQAVANAGGTVVAEATIVDIAYHALLVRVPADLIRALIEGDADDVALVRVDEIAFVRPEAQAFVELPSPDTTDRPFPPGPDLVEEPPLVAVLDGLPLAAHSALDGRIVLDDPDDWGSTIAPAERLHGTAITSVVLHGDQGSQASERGPRRPVYVRPIMKPFPTTAGTRERIPDDVLAVDLVHRAVIRLTEVAPTVRLVNLSVGDGANPLATTLSPWARLLDYLAYEFDLLFVISAGNQLRPIDFDVDAATLDALDDAKMRAKTLEVLLNDAANRRVISPAEAMTALCVGAAHDDDCETYVAGARRDLLRGSASGPEALPSPLSGLGMGYRRSIKPDMLAPGGRLLYRLQPAALTTPASYLPNPSPLAPGIRAASPGGVAGVLDEFVFIQGTSASAALVSHYGARILELLDRLTNDSGVEVDPLASAVLTKALLVHSCRLTPSSDEIASLLTGMSPTRIKDGVSRFLGYGVLDSDRILRGDAQRATALGWGRLRDEEALRFDLPLPPSLAGVSGGRRLVITLAYFPPLRTASRQHRAAELYFKPVTEPLRLRRQGADWQTVKRGTLQHEVLGGTLVSAYVDGATIPIQVNCRALVKPMRDAVPFGLAVTLEAEASIPLHAEVAARIRNQVQARVRS